MPNHGHVVSVMLPDESIGLVEVYSDVQQFAHRLHLHEVP